MHSLRKTQIKKKIIMKHNPFFKDPDSPSMKKQDEQKVLRNSQGEGQSLGQRWKWGETKIREQGVVISNTVQTIFNQQCMCKNKHVGTARYPSG